jgi:PAS domain S-box-containing protein
MVGVIPMHTEQTRATASCDSYDSLEARIIEQYPLTDVTDDGTLADLIDLAAQVCHCPIALFCVASHTHTEAEPQDYWCKIVRGTTLNMLPGALPWLQQTLASTEGVFECDLLVQESGEDCSDVEANYAFPHDPPLRFYAGLPLIMADGIRIGILAVLSWRTRSLKPDQKQALQALGRQIIHYLVLHQATLPTALPVPPIPINQSDLKQSDLKQSGSKQAENTLQKAFQELADIKFALDEHAIVSITDSQGRITYANQKFCEVSGYDLTEVIGQDHRLINSGHHPSEFFADLWNTVQAGKVWKGEICNRTQAGELFWVDTTIVPIPEDASKYPNLSYHYISIRTDITQRKQTEIALRERSQLAAMGTTVGEILSHGGINNQVLVDCADAIVGYLDLPFARIWTFDQESNVLTLEAIAGQHSHTEDFPKRISLGISIIGFIAQTRKIYQTNDVANDLCIGAKQWVQQEQLQGFVGYPLVMEERLMGVLALFSYHPFTEPMLDALEWIANALAVAIDRASAREALMSRREALLFRLASQIRNSLNLDEILSTTVHEIRTLLKIDRCHFIWCWTNQDPPFLVVTHEAREEGAPSLMGDCPPDQAAALADLLLTLEMVRIDNLDSEENPDLAPILLERMQTNGIVSQLMLPLENRSGQLGAIVCSHGSAHQWGESEVELLRAVVDQMAIAMDQAELYARSRAATLAAETQAEQLSEALQDLRQTQAQLVQTEKMSSLGQMVAGIAHEINNPVNFISGNLNHAQNYIQDLLELIELYQEHHPEPADAVQEHAEDIDLEFLLDDLPKLLNSMKIGAERIRQIVLSLRNFSRLDEAEMKQVDIHEGIDSTLLILHNRLKGSPTCSCIEVVKHYDQLPPVECYAGQLNQVFMNILANAIDALEERPEPAITITTEFIADSAREPSLEPTPGSEADLPDHLAHLAQKTDRPAGMVVIRIRDNGAGMTPATIDKLFDPFFTTKPVGKGTGLGMSISYQIIVQKHGGSLECTSELGKGTEFTIQIPSVQNRQPDHPQETSPGELPQP